MEESEREMERKRERKIEERFGKGEGRHSLCQLSPLYLFLSLSPSPPCYFRHGSECYNSLKRYLSCIIPENLGLKDELFPSNFRFFARLILEYSRNIFNCY